MSDRPGFGRREFLKATGVSTGLTLAAGCIGGGDGSGGEIVIGNAAPLSGSFSPWGQFHQAGLEFGIKEINNNGGVLDGRNLTAVSEDTEANPQKAATSVQRLVDTENATVITGPVSSDVGIRVRRETEQLQVPHLPNQASSPQLLTKDTRYTFRVGGSATPTFASGSADLIKDRGYTEYGAIIADYGYGHSYRAGLEEFVLSNENINSTVSVAPVGADDFTSYLREMPDDIEVMDLGGHPVGIFTIAQQMSELGIEPKITTGPNIPTPVFYETLQDQVAQSLTLFPAVDPSPSGGEYVEIGNRYYEETGEFFDMYTAFGYVTANLVATAIEDAGEASPQAIRDAISSIEYDTILSYPLSYTEWGELQSVSLNAIQFTLEAPEYYPDGNYGFEKIYETSTFDPIDPTNWG